MSLGPALWLHCLFLWPVPEMLAPPLCLLFLLDSGVPHTLFPPLQLPLGRVLCQELREGVGKMGVPPQL